ncbi:hypothetical protein LXL04_032745 [Taraxacum kok-saghyz]
MRIAPLYASPFLSGALRIPIPDSQPQPRSSPFPLHACTLPPIPFQMVRKFIDFHCKQRAQPRNLIDFPLYIYPFEDRGCREIRFRACGIDQKSVEAWAGMAEADSVVGEASVVTVSHRMKLTTSNSTNIARQRFGNMCRFEIGNRDEEAPLFQNCVGLIKELKRYELMDDELDDVDQEGLKHGELLSLYTSIHC